MATILFGDFRLRQLQAYKTNVDDEDSGYAYLTEDDAEYSWFKNEFNTQLPQLSLSGANVVIMMGFNDCVYSCVWSSFDIENIAKKYAELINKAIEQHSSIKFFVCSINPINSTYPFAPYGTTGIIPENTLMSKIKKFNSTIKKECKATYIDCYSYLTSTSYSTRDGVRFDQDTCEVIHNYLEGHFGSYTSTGNIDITKRDTEALAPKMPGSGSTTVDESYLYWMSTSWTHSDKVTKGYNIYAAVKNGCVLPNCTGYAWGRFMEILGTEPKLPLANAGDWYGYTGDKYSRGKPGDAPKEGAVICWGKEGEAGHVGIVESVDTTTGIIKTSESGWRDEKPAYDPNKHFWVTTRIYDKTTKNWRLCVDGKPTSSTIDGYDFQGFIYNPMTVGTASASESVPKSSVVSKSSGLSQSEMEINAKYIWNYLGNKGWTLNAVAGMLGNMECESSINPGRQESLGSGYGLVQWTPKSKLTNWLAEKGLKDDIDGQLERIIWEKDTGAQYSKNHYKYTFKEFAESTDDPYTLACAFVFDYERPGVAIWGFHTNSHGSYCGNAAFDIACKPCYQAKYGEEATKKQVEKNRQALRDKRGKAAEKWYKYLCPYAPSSIFEEKFTAGNLKIDSLSSTKVKVSFIASNSESYTYKLLDSKNKEIKKKEKKLDSTKSSQLIKLTFKDLTPNKKYKLLVDVTSSIGGETRNLELPIKTPQSLPGSVEEITFNTKGLKTDLNNFKLTVKKPESFGYWTNKSKGYELQLIKNGRCIKKVSISGATDLSYNSFNLKKTFGYSCKIGDSLQIGVRVWIAVNDTTTIYDSDIPKVSKVVCLLEKPVTAFLNTDNKIS